MKSKSKSNSPPFIWPSFSSPPNPNIHDINDLGNWLNEICDNEKEYTDQELASKLKETLDFRMGNNPTFSIYFTHHYRSEEIVKQRAKRYCKKNHIKLEDYNGPLPYRTFLIDTFPNPQKDRRLKLERIMKQQKKRIFLTKIKSVWKHILGKENRIA